MSTALTRVNPSISTVFENPQAWSTLKDIAVVMFAGGGQLGVLPACFKTTQQVQAGMLVLMGMGEDPIAGLQHIHPLPGNKIGFDYKFLMGLVEARAPQWRYGVDEQDDQHIKGWFRASESHPIYTLTYTLAEAETADLVKKGSAWEKHPQDMLFKSWWLRGARRTAPAALRGIGIQHDVELADDDADATTDAPTPPATLGEKVDAALAKGKSEAVVIDSGAAAPSGGSGGAAGAPAPEPEKPIDWQARFLALGRLCGLLVNVPVKGKALWDKVRPILEELLTESGVRPNIPSPQTMPTADWRLAYERLAERYDPETGKPTGKGKKAGVGNGDKPIPPAARDAAPAPAEDTPPEGDEPPPSDEPPGDEDGAAALAAQMSDPDYLLDLARSLELAWKQPGTVVKESPKGSGKWWFTNADILRTCGFVDDAGAVIPKALYSGASKPEWCLDERQTFALSTQVTEELTKAQAKRR